MSENVNGQGHKNTSSRILNSLVYVSSYLDACYTLAGGLLHFLHKNLKKDGFNIDNLK